MKNIQFVSWMLLLTLIGFTSCKNAPISKYTYETAANDPLNAKIYTLDNGLKIYMSVYKDEPRIQTYISVASGSKHDPAHCTGLAHYLEHMMFKGTDKIGSLDWEKEKVMLQQISDLYDEHSKEKDPAKRKAIYKKIDEVSNNAAKLVAANEYDKMVGSLGAKGTNAYTSVEETVYVNDIPSNELRKFLALESERFKMLVLRLFHTELEAVYEEFNISQDRDGRKVNKALFQSLFPNHTYGTQTTIGEGEHLKNPSHVEIHKYFNKFYVPNNMAVILSGDFNPDDAVDMVKEYFGDMKTKEIPEWTFEEQPEIKAPIVHEIFGQEEEFVDNGWRLGGAKTDDAIKMELVTKILSNGQAGLIDLNLIQKQKILKGTAYGWSWADYSLFGIEGNPREGQKLEEVRDLLLGELENLKAGKFDEWLVEACKKDIKLSRMKQLESNRGRASELNEAFVRGLDWDFYASKFDRMDKITKADLVDFAKKNLNDNRVLIYKRTGTDKDAMKVEKPTITPVELNREKESNFLADFNKMESDVINPVFVDYKKDIKELKLDNGVALDYIENPYNKTFSLYYVFEMGKMHDKKLPLAIKYLPYLGTDKYSAEQLQQEFFKLGVSFDVFSSDDRAYVTLSGLEESLEQGVELFEHILANVKADDTALAGVVKDIIKSRQDSKKDKRTILRQAMGNYAKYGPLSSFTDIIPETELKTIKAQELVSKIKGLTGYEHRVFYYGKNSASSVKALINKYHKVPAELKPYPAKTEYKEVATTENKVYYVDFPMVQAEILMLSKGDKYDAEQDMMADLYNNYFGFGLSSIVFQEIRESKGLAYSAYAYYSSPDEKKESHYLQAYLGTQADKLKDAVPEMENILTNMPVADSQIENARSSLLKKIESERITKTGIYFNYLANKKLGYDYDIRKDLYNKMKSTTKEDLLQFHEKNVKDRKFTYLVLGEKSRINMDYLKTIGNVEELTMEQIFGYKDENTSIKN